MKFKGTNGIWSIQNSIDIVSDESPGIIAQVFDGEETHVSEQIEVLQEPNIRLMVDAGNLRQKLDCDLNEFHERYLKMEEALKSVISLRQLIEYPDNTEPEHHEEAGAIAVMMIEVENALNK
jgi:hypothetical protein